MAAIEGARARAGLARARTDVHTRPDRMVIGSASSALPATLRVIVGCTEAEATRVRPLALEAYGEAHARQWPFLSDVLERTVRGLSDPDRAAVVAVVHALVKYDRLLEFAVQSDRLLPRFEALWAIQRGDARDVQARIERIETPTERLGVAFSFPDWIVDRVGSELGDVERALALDRMNAIAPRVIRANTLRTTREDLLRALEGEGVPACAASHGSNAVVIESSRSPFGTQAFARGDFEMQDEASQLVVDLVAPPPGSLVIDACAGAGGKTLALAALLGGKGRVVALDASESKLGELRRRARRAGASNVRAVAVDLLEPGDALRDCEGAAARVLVDAPCSGLGAIRRNPEIRWRLRPGDMTRLESAQAALTRAVAHLVAPRGRLVFATCSFLPSEGERAVEAFLAESRAFTAVTARDVLGRARTETVATPDGKYFRTWRFDGAADGSDAGMDGFFAAVVRRTAPAA